MLTVDLPHGDPGPSWYDSARQLTHRIERLIRESGPAAVLAVAPPWWLTIALQQRALALAPGPPPRWILWCPESTGPHRKESVDRNRMHGCAWMEERARSLADAVLSVPSAADAGVPHAAAGGAAGWLESLPNGGEAAWQRARTVARPWIGVVVVHHDRPALLAQALTSLKRQTCPPDAVVVVDAATPDRAVRAQARALVASVRYPPVRWVQGRTPSLGAARNIGVGALIQAGAPADGWVLFMDDDNVAPSHALAVFGRAAAVGDADAWTCWAALFDGEAPPPPGADPERAPLYAPPGPVPALLGGPANPAGDANMLIRLSAFRRLGGFDPDAAVAGEDWDLLVRAAVLQLRQSVVPQALVWKRRTPGSMSARMPWGPARVRVRAALRAAGVPT